MIYYSTSLIGLRDANEDQHDIIINLDGHNNKLNNVNYFAVYDGHGGNKISKYLKNHLSKYFLDKSIKYPLSRKQINNIFDHMQKKIMRHDNYAAHNSGSTCLSMINYKQNDKIYMYIFNVGDCRAVKCTNNMAIPLTLDHKPNWPVERKRITQLGGKIYLDGDDYRIKDLSVSRAFGDVDSIPYVTHLPDIYKYVVDNHDQFIILGCDGLWDVLTNQQAINYVLDNIVNKKGECNDKRKNIAKNLAEYAIKKGSADNITAIIIFLHN